MALRPLNRIVSGFIVLALLSVGVRESAAQAIGVPIMVGAIVTNKSPVTLDQVTPLARLTGEYTAIVVPTESPLTSLDQLVEKFKSDPGSVSWGGGSAGVIINGGSGAQALQPRDGAFVRAHSQ